MSRACTYASQVTLKRGWCSLRASHIKRHKWVIDYRALCGSLPVHTWAAVKTSLGVVIWLWLSWQACAICCWSSPYPLQQQNALCCENLDRGHRYTCMVFSVDSSGVLTKFWVGSVISMKKYSRSLGENSIWRWLQMTPSKGIESKQTLNTLWKVQVMSIAI